MRIAHQGRRGTLHRRPLDGAVLQLETTLAAWADIYTGRRSLAQVCADGDAKALPGTAAVAAFFEYFDHVRVA